MSEVSEMLENAEHAAEGGHEGGNSGKMIGLTMASLGVLLALCAAQVGAARTELIKTMVEQTQANAEQQSQATKYRMLFSQLEQLRAIAPTDAQVSALHHQLDALHAAAGPQQGDAVQGSLIAGVGISEMLQPTPLPLARLIGLTRKAAHKIELAHHWTETYEEAIGSHNNQAEGFEKGQLCAEVGIVLSSIALTLKNKLIWGGSLLLGAACVGLIVFTSVTEKPRLHRAEIDIEEAHHHYADAATGLKSAADEDETLRALQEGMGPKLLQIAGGGVPAAHEAAPAAAPGAEHP